MRRHSVPDEVALALWALVRDGRTIEAIKMLRAEGGGSLADARALVATIRHPDDAATALRDLVPEPQSGVPNEVRRLLAEGRRVAAVKYIREAHGLSLKAAAERVDAMMTPSQRAKTADARRAARGCALSLLAALLAGAVWWLS